MGRNYDVITFTSKNLYFKIGLEWPILLTSWKLQPFLLKQPLKTQKKSKELEIMY